MKKSTVMAMMALVLVVNPAFAHINPVEHGSIVAGVTHPLSGADHVLAMVAVGLWATMLGGRALYIVPAAFVGVLLLGFVVALAGFPLPFVEPAILASVVVIGLLGALALPVSPAAGAVIVGFFAFFHGHAHGSEIGDSAFPGYGVGFVLATIMLHVVGIGIGFGVGGPLSGRSGSVALRVASGTTALGGVMLMAG